MIDESGNEYVCQRVQFGTREASVVGFGLGAAENTLVSGTPTNLTLTFDEVAPQSNRISLLEIHGFVQKAGGVRYRSEMKKIVASIRNIPIAK